MEENRLPMMNFTILNYIIELKLQKHELEVKLNLISGASGTWQYNYDPEKIEEFGIYAILEGELGGIPT
ncbi:MAG: hypothetical protein CM1200mP11_4610 [Nitrosopumilaceae archaeon]|nr:MAG: hypothetical protein CM1200mP11_4610 [Nitrosopumilaceae archaeon]